MPGIDEVHSWITRGEMQVARLEALTTETQQQLTRARKQLNLYCEILATLSKVPVLVSSSEPPAVESVGDRTVAAAEAILRDVARPMAIGDIHTEFIRRDIPLPGRGTPANIIVHLTASPRIVRIGRGLYGLAEWQQLVAAEQTSPQFGEQEAMDG